jgi:hypothetical protein
MVVFAFVEEILVFLGKNEVYDGYPSQGIQREFGF